MLFFKSFQAEFYSMPKPIIYIAGPDVFYPSALSHLLSKQEFCRSQGFEAVIPVDNEHDTEGHVGFNIFMGNIKQMEKADLIIANITPFRGPHMDPGTAFEVGYFAAMNKPVFCYSDSEFKLLDRVRSDDEASFVYRDKEGNIRDQDDFLVEDFNFHENLMISGAALNSSSGAYECASSFETAVLNAKELLLSPNFKKKLNP